MRNLITSNSLAVHFKFCFVTYNTSLCLSSSLSCFKGERNDLFNLLEVTKLERN